MTFLKQKGLIFILLLSLSCNSTKTTYNHELQKRVRVFESNEIEFNYPTSWETFNSLPIKKTKNLVSICPKKKKYEGFMFTTYEHSGKLDTIITSKEFINKKKYQDVQVINQNFEHASVYINIIEIDVPQAEIENYIAKRLEQYKDNKNTEMEVQKIASDFYIVRMKNHRKEEIIKNPYQERLYKIYLRCTPSKSYEIIYSTNAYFYNDYLDDANLVLRSFTIK